MAKTRKFDPAKLAALFEEHGVEEKVEVKKNDPTVTGKGVSKAVKATKVNKELEKAVGAKPEPAKPPPPSKKKPKEPDRDAMAQTDDLGLGPTAKDKERQYRAAKDKALKAVIELPPTQGDLKVLAETKLDPKTKVMRYHGGMGWTVTLMWLEMKKVDDKPEPFVAKVHAIVQTDNGSLSYEKMRPEEIRNFAEILGGYPIGPAINAFREHADRNGSSKEVRILLGMAGDSPVKFDKVIERNDQGHAVGEKLIERKNANKQPGGPVNEEIDALYKRAAKLLDLNETDLRNKYRHLNPGLQAMNLRNRLRAKGHNT